VGQGVGDVLLLLQQEHQQVVEVQAGQPEALLQEGQVWWVPPSRVMEAA
jgi:hypothetical protein